MLAEENIPNSIKIRTKNIDGVYKSLALNNKFTDIHDLLALKIMVEDVKNCYVTLGLIHSKYPPLNDRFKDYIAISKTNMYQSLHTTVFSPNEKLVQAQIRTYDMDKIASFGLTAYWHLNKGKAKDKMHQDLNKKFQFFTSLKELNRIIPDNKEFIDQVKKEFFTGNIYVYTTKGDIIELPVGSNIIDFAYKLNAEIGNTLVGAKVNDQFVGLDYRLNNKEIVKLLTNEGVFGLERKWLEKVHTAYAKKKIKEFNGNNGEKRGIE